MKEALICAMDIGEQMLLCGAEIHRVEDSLERMCYALGAKRIDVFIITSSMTVSLMPRSRERSPSFSVAIKSRHSSRLSSAPSYVLWCC